MSTPRTLGSASLVATGTLATLAALASTPLSIHAQSTGEDVFRTTCSACHTTGSDRLVGPGLEEITSRRDRDWLIAFITTPDQVLASGDSIASRLLAEYIVPMPNLGTTVAQAEAILDYLESATGTEPASQVQDLPPPTEDQVLLGQALFQGDTRLANGGPTCNSCHEVTNDAVIGGGILAKELTTVFTDLGGAEAVRRMIGGPPHAVMRKAYEDKPLTEEEVSALVAFLERADEEQALHQPRDYGIKLFGAGAVGAVVLLSLYSLAWSGRKRGSVNQAIFDRQMRST